MLWIQTPPPSKDYFVKEKYYSANLIFELMVLIELSAYGTTIWTVSDDQGVQGLENDNIFNENFLSWKF